MLYLLNSTLSLICFSLLLWNSGICEKVGLEEREKKWNLVTIQNDGALHSTFSLPFWICSYHVCLNTKSYLQIICVVSAKMEKKLYFTRNNKGICICNSFGFIYLYFLCVLKLFRTKKRGHTDIWALAFAKYIYLQRCGSTIGEKRLILSTHLTEAIENSHKVKMVCH